LLVRLILYPLTLKQTKEMAKMQKLQPKLKDLQDRYKDNPQKMNEEVLKLYTKNKVNPIGGCFPILLQLPIIMALFNTFRNAVELRKASFLWMSDLSKGDPYMILPIAIAVLMFYQQGKSNIDPQQRQAMAFMPMMMLFITFSLPSGLLVYWFASSVLGILQQLQANHYMASIKEEN
jgi:YidC/Oxa1 family membrane protein insertase